MRGFEGAAPEDRGRLAGKLILEWLRPISISILALHRVRLVSQLD
jgi:hypothetical protein